ASHSTQNFEQLASGEEFFSSRLPKLSIRHTGHRRCEGADYSTVFRGFPQNFSAAANILPCAPFP
ncbi:MAG: hypothetical protein KUL80_02870, partial [Comamonas sp.]|nr:hypothetical protein [Comamonas sp.]